LLISQEDRQSQAIPQSFWESKYSSFKNSRELLVALETRIFEKFTGNLRDYAFDMFSHKLVADRDYQRFCFSVAISLQERENHALRMLLLLGKCVKVK
jgi:hypothetical protein